MENCDAFELIGRMDSPTTAMYVDPPYLRSTRNIFGSGHYVQEMDREPEHRRLLEVLAACKSAIVLSGYRSPLYDELLADWRRIDYRVRASSSDERRHAVESVWVNR
ncbi:hypothetical protein [Nonomuraea sp. NPDC049750]|uniref:hypothetical protein n=1 Tax=Nonomuraea sp. NPDC049750 TaxID=3154738 RepID=UPI0033C0441B